MPNALAAHYSFKMMNCPLPTTDVPSSLDEEGDSPDNDGHPPLP